jgi:hypothetical protein
LERLKQGKYSKPHWLRYVRGHKPPGPTEEEKEEEKCMSFGFLVINVCNHGEHYETPCIILTQFNNLKQNIHTLSI